MSTHPLTTLRSTVGESGADARILQAALDAFAEAGVRRTSADDIARRAGVNRATLYRRLGSMDEIVTAAMLYEAGRVLAEIESGVGDLPEPPTRAQIDDYVVAFFTVTIATLRGNRLLTRLLDVDRDETLRVLTVGAAEVLQLTAAFLAEPIRRIRGHTGGSTDPDEIDALSALLARLTLSLLLTPDGPPTLDTEQQQRWFAETVLAPMIAGAPAG